jgi:pilus assembly protein Flp/PilA
MERIKRFFKEEEGVTSLEYGLIAAVTCVAILAGLAIVRPNLQAIWTTIGGALAP